MSNNLTSNHFSWSELMTSAPKQAVEFYGQLFGWQFETMDMQGQDYFVALCDKEKIAGIMACPTPEQPPCWGRCRPSSTGVSTSSCARNAATLDEHPGTEVLGTREP